MLWWKTLIEYIGGAQDEPPPGTAVHPNAIAWGIWWGVLVCLIAVFCGQSSKFIYIDF